MQVPWRNTCRTLISKWWDWIVHSGIKIKIKNVNRSQITHFVISESCVQSSIFVLKLNKLIESWKLLQRDTGNVIQELYFETQVTVVMTTRALLTLFHRYRLCCRIFSFVTKYRSPCGTRKLYENDAPSFHKKYNDHDQGSTGKQKSIVYTNVGGTHRVLPKSTFINKKEHNVTQNYL